jgi:hypothetical protein
MFQDLWREKNQGGQVYNQGTQKACLTSKSANVSVSNESIL